VFEQQQAVRRRPVDPRGMPALLDGPSVAVRHLSAGPVDLEETHVSRLSPTTLRRGALLLALLLVGCGEPTRQVVRVINRSPQPVRVRLEERHPSYPTSVTDDVDLAPGAEVELWWEKDFKTSIVIRDAGRELQRQALVIGVTEVIHGK
jgi:hypothetical protein